MFLSSIPCVFWINLDRAEGRRNRMQLLFEEYKVANQRVPAFDGKDRSLLGVTYLPDYRIPLLAQCCTLSHLKAINSFYSSGNEIGLIMEDDVSFEFVENANFSFSQLLSKAPDGWEILQLSYTVMDDKVTSSIQCATDLFLPREEKMYSAVCYAINRTGARKVLESIWTHSPIDLSLTKTDPYADTIIFEQAITYTCKFALFTYPSENDSFINPQYLEIHRKAKEFAQQVWRESIDKYF